MPIIEIAKLQVRRGQEHQTGVPQLDPGEMAWAEDTENLYIGKRIVEGASTDANSRILTEKDLSTIFQIASQAAAAATSSTAYRYRADLPYGNSTGDILSTTSTFAQKLDNWVSLTDFVPGGIWPPYAIPGTYPDITQTLGNAIGISSGTTGGGVVFGIGPIAIKIPAGTYWINSTINLPPYTTLIGDGVGMTTLIYSGAGNTSQPMFQTVDSNGNAFTQQTYSSPGLPSNITLKDMTLEFPLNSAINSALLSLDNVQNVKISNVNFGSYGHYSTGTGIGITIRGSFPAGSVGDVKMYPTNNIIIDNCYFTALSTGILSTGSVNKVVVENSKFTFLTNGVMAYTNYSASGPQNDTLNAVINNNLFENIQYEALVIGTLTNTVTSYAVSSNNVYRGVGNGLANEAHNVTPVITFNDLGGQSVNDYFDRAVSTTTVNSLYVIPWVSGNATIRNDATHVLSVLSNANTNLMMIPLTSGVQKATVDYTLSNKDMYRSGQLLINVSTPGSNIIPDGFASVSDYYNYTEYSSQSSNNVSFTIDTTHSLLPYFANASYATYPYGYCNSDLLIGINSFTCKLLWSDYQTISSGMNISFPTYHSAFATGATATVVSASFDPVLDTVTIATDRSIHQNILGLSPVVFTTATLVTWTNGSIFNFPISLDPYNNIQAIQNNNVLQAYIAVNNTPSTVQHLQDLLAGGSSSTYLITGTSVVQTAIQNVNSYYQLQFNISTPRVIYPQDIVSVYIFCAGTYQNFVSLVCESIDGNPTSLEYSYKLLN